MNSVKLKVINRKLSSKKKLTEFLREHEQCFSPSAFEMSNSGKELIFLFCDQEAYGDRYYYYCEDDNKVYSNYYSIGD